MSFSESIILSPMKNPLFNILVCVRQAAFGMLVVPEVNWILMISFACNSSPAKPVLVPDDELRSSVKGVVAFRSDMSMRPDELSTSMMF